MVITCKSCKLSDTITYKRRPFLWGVAISCREVAPYPWIGPAGDIWVFRCSIYCRWLNYPNTQECLAEKRCWCKGSYEDAFSVFIGNCSAVSEDTPLLILITNEQLQAAFCRPVAAFKAGSTSPVVVSAFFLPVCCIPESGPHAACSELRHHSVQCAVRARIMVQEQLEVCHALGSEVLNERYC